jgi:phosphoserine phosphatase RsbU/P
MQARRTVRAALSDAGLDELVETAILLASELCENAVLHGGTEFELAVTTAPGEATIEVTDKGPGPLELRLAAPRTGRAATHGRGLALVDALATAWGTRHDVRGHATWFVLREPGQRGPAVTGVDTEAAGGAAVPWPTVQTTRWLLRVTPELAARLDQPGLVAELLRRLCEVLAADGAEVGVDYGDGSQPQELAQCGIAPDGTALSVALPLPAPLSGELRVAAPDRSATTIEVCELVAQRIALAVESAWMRGADQRRRAWMTYLAELSELLPQSLNAELTTAVVPRLLVPRLGQWAAVHLIDERGVLALAALTHADEEAVPALRATLDTPAHGAIHGTVQHQLTAALARSGSPTGLLSPDGVAVALTARGQHLGTLAVGRPPDRPHSSEEIMLICDVARRAALAIDNAQTTTRHVETSQALQKALLPRQLPVARGVEFAAEYLPAGTGSDVGGDFYDVLTLGEGCWLGSIGDVCGKGARAAARTGLVRDVLRVLVNDGRSPQRAIELLNDVMMDADDPQLFCTLATMLVLRPATGSPPGLGIDLILAGHEQPVLLRADGHAELIGEHGTAVGLTQNISPTTTRHWLRPGDALVAYTDGVTERRLGREQFGQDRLLKTLSTAAGRSADDLVATVRDAVEEFSSDPHRDDIAILAIRAQPT